MQALLLALAFVLEIVAFIAFSAFGYVFPLPEWAHLALFAVLFVALVSFWGVYMAPKAPKKLDLIPYYIAKAIIYTVSAVTIFFTRGAAPCSTFMLLALLDEALLFRHNLS
ncbi:MAG TPA: DUF2568 domain-containing protein [Candidatus Saccharimonadales bacterium]|nr:DUF2568 domain-containing protein [Candidatus Saccharimonadales bacterium]